MLTRERVHEIFDIKESYKLPDKIMELIFYFLSHKEAEVAINKIGEKRLLIEYFKIPEDEL